VTAPELLRHMRQPLDPMPAWAALDELQEQHGGDRAAAVRALCDAIHGVLDEAREDHAARLLVADVLAVDGHAEADGWLALGNEVRNPRAFPDQGPLTGSWQDARDSYRECRDLPHALPADWFAVLLGGSSAWSPGFRDYTSRREADEAAVQAFARLGRKRRAKLLGAVPEGVR
jgi:hypothetical protein